MPVPLTLMPRLVRRGVHLAADAGAVSGHDELRRTAYWLAPGRRVILLTVFPKTRSAETREVARALHAQKICETEHGAAHQVFDREVN